MLKRRAAWPRAIRWLGAVVVVVLALAIVWALFVPLADWLAHHDVGPVKGSLHETALDNARGRLLTLGAGLFAAGALVFTARNFTLSREGQVTDRYTKAIEQLGSDKLDVRIGGIYALERVARDSARDHPTVMEVLTAFIREHSHEQWPPPDDPGRGQERSTGPDQERSMRPDVRAALTVVGRRATRRDIGSIDLGGATLPGAILRYAVLTYANLGGADLTGADLVRADLTYANLRGTNLGGTNLGGAVLRHAFLTGADLARADLAYANLRGADLTDADLTGAGLGRADLSAVQLIDANLSGADLRGATLVGAQLWRGNVVGARLGGADFTHAGLGGADLTDAVLRDADEDAVNAAYPDLGPVLGGAVFTGAHLDNARWPEGAPVPEGWRRDPGSGRLTVAGTDSGPAEAN